MSGMTSTDLRAWQAQTGHTFRSAAAALDVSVSTYSAWMAGAKISKIAAFALAAIAAGIEPWGADPFQATSLGGAARGLSDQSGTACYAKNTECK